VPDCHDQGAEDQQRRNPPQRKKRRRERERNTAEQCPERKRTTGSCADRGTGEETRDRDEQTQERNDDKRSPRSRLNRLGANPAVLDRCLRRLTLADNLRDPIESLSDAPRIIPCAKLRHDGGSNDLARPAVWKDRFQSVTNFDAHGAVACRDEQQHAVVFLLFSDAPLRKQTIGVLLDRHAVQRRHRHHSHFGGCVSFESVEVILEVDFVGRGQHRGKVVDVPVVNWKRRKQRDLQRQHNHRCTMNDD
jgi:hypothetical protein